MSLNIFLKINNKNTFIFEKNKKFKKNTFINEKEREEREKNRKK